MTARTSNLPKTWLLRYWGQRQAGESYARLETKILECDEAEAVKEYADCADEKRGPQLFRANWEPVLPLEPLP